jgi:hypothetical protein
MHARTGNAIHHKNCFAIHDGRDARLLVDFASLQPCVYRSFILFPRPFRVGTYAKSPGRFVDECLIPVTTAGLRAGRKHCECAFKLIALEAALPRGEAECKRLHVAFSRRTFSGLRFRACGTDRSIEALLPIIEILPSSFLSPWPPYTEEQVSAAWRTAVTKVSRRSRSQAHQRDAGLQTQGD